METSNSLILSGVTTRESKDPISIIIERGVIENIKKSNDEGFRFEEAIAFPGLFNMHDHLSFNMFPLLSKKGGHANYIEWSDFIHQNFKELIDSINSIPKNDRVYVGILKNLLCGVTTVCDHHFSTGPLPFLDNIEDYVYVHSIQKHKRWYLKVLLAFFQSNPIMLHINEGYGNNVEHEILLLKKWNFLKNRVIGIHGTSLKEENLELLDALIWCPLSNTTLYGSTAPIEKIIGKIPVLFGSDSTLSGEANLWNHIRKGIDIVGEVEPIYDMLTKAPANYFDSQKNKGEIAIGKQADLVIARKKESIFYDSFYKTNPADILLVVKNGKVIFSKSKKLAPANFVNIRGLESSGYVCKSLVKDLSSEAILRAPFDLMI